jgi:hypothetical protein
MKTKLLIGTILLATFIVAFMLVTIITDSYARYVGFYAQGLIDSAAVSE